MAESINEILNKLYAMKLAGITNLAEIAKAVGSRRERVSEWVTQRSHFPNGKTAEKLKKFAAKQTIRIVMQPQRAATYRQAFLTAKLLFPDEGREK